MVDGTDIGVDNNEAEKVKANVELVGDSTLNNIHGRGLSNNCHIKVNNHPGVTSEDIKHRVNPAINRKLDMLVVHIGISTPL